MLDELIIHADRLFGSEPARLIPEPEYIEAVWRRIEGIPVMGFISFLGSSYGEDTIRAAGLLLGILRKTAENLGKASEFDRLLSSIGAATCTKLSTEMKGHEEEFCGGPFRVLMKARVLLTILNGLGAKSSRRLWMVGQMSILELLHRAET